MRIPRGTMLKHGIHDDQQLPHAGSQGHFGRFALAAQTLVNSRTCRGLTTATARACAANAPTSAVSSPPVASMTISVGGCSSKRLTNPEWLRPSVPPAASGRSARQCPASPWRHQFRQTMHVCSFRYPALQKSGLEHAQSTVRVTRTSGTTAHG